MSSSDATPRAWLVVAGALATQLCNMGYFQSWGVYQLYYSTHTLWREKASTIAWVGSTQLALLHFCGLVSGPLAQRFGTQAVLLPASVGFVASVMLTSICKHYYQILLCQGILNGLCGGMIFTPSMATVSQYFTSKRAFATSVAMNGVSIGGIIFPVLLGHLFECPGIQFGWAVRIAAFAMLLLFLFSCSVLRTKAHKDERNYLLLSAFTFQPYTIATVGFAFTLLGLFTPYIFIAQYSLEQKMAIDLAYLQVTILHLGAFIGRFAWGYTADRLGCFNTTVIATTMSGVLLFCWTKVHLEIGMMIFCALYGFASGPIPSLHVSCIVQVTPRQRDHGVYIGMSMSVTALCALIGGPCNGVMLDRFGWWSVTVFSGVTVLSGAISYVIARLLLRREALCVI